MSVALHEYFAFSAAVAQSAPIEYHSDRSGRLVWSRFQVYSTIFKTLSYGKSNELDHCIDCNFVDRGFYSPVCDCYRIIDVIHEICMGIDVSASDAQLKPAAASGKRGSNSVKEPE